MKTWLRFITIIGLATVVLSPSAGKTASIAHAKEGSLPPIYLPFVSLHYNSGPGTVTGKVVDSSRRQEGGSEAVPIEGASVCYGETCTTTNEDGVYTLNDIPSDWQQLTTSMDGFFSETAGVIVRAGESAVLNFSLMPDWVGDVKLRVVVTWDPTPYWVDPLTGNTQPNDLDAHLWVFGSTASKHVHAGDGSDDPAINCLNFPSACLEADKQYGYGPETIAIRKEVSADRYYFGVLNYNAAYSYVPAIPNLDAKVNVYDEDGLIRTFKPPTIGSGDFWYVFSITRDAEDELPITETNCITVLPDDTTPPSCE
jgi:hypothetical protein